MYETPQQNKAPPLKFLRRLFNHHRFLRSSGQFGSELDWSRPLIGLDLRGVDMSHASMPHALIANCLLDGASFAGANIGGVIFKDCSLTFVDFSRAQLMQATMTGCNLQGARFDGAWVYALEIDGVPLQPGAITFGVEPK